MNLMVLLSSKRKVVIPEAHVLMEAKNTYAFISITKEQAPGSMKELLILMPMTFHLTNHFATT